MKQKVIIDGLHCQSCIKKINDYLTTKEEVEEALINFAPEHSILTLKKSISKNNLSAWLAEIGDYKLVSEADERTENKFKTYKPLFVSFLFLSISSLIITLYYGHSLHFGMHIFMGAFFLLFSFFKFLDLAGFAKSFASYDIIAGQIKLYGYAYPFIEFLLAWGYLCFWPIPIIYIVTIIVLGLGTIGVYKTVKNKKSIQCACMGNVFDLPMSKITIFENVLMMAMALIMLIYYLK